MLTRSLWRILLAPGDVGGGGSPAPVSAPAPSAPAPISAPSPGPASPERGSVNQASTNSGDRSFEIPDQGSAGLGQTQGGNQSAPRAGLPNPTDPNQAAGANAGLPANFQSIRDAAAEYGYQFSQDVTDDRTALMRLVHAAQANNYNAQLGQRLAPHAQQFQNFLAQQQQPVQQAPAARPDWEAPPFDQRWAGLVVQDPSGSGLYLSKPGVDPSIGQAVSEYVEWKAKFDANPSAVMNGMVEKAARQMALEVYQQQNAITTRTQAAQNIIRDISPWLFAKDAQGNVQRDWQGQAQYTPVGATYVRHLTAVRQAGVTDPVAQDRFARQLMQGEFAGRAATQQQQVAQNQSFPVQQATQVVNTNPLHSLPPQQQAITAGVTVPGEEGLSLFERMQRNFAAGGINDSHFAPENM